MTVSRNTGDNFLKLWHFHDELELVHIIESTGTRFVGDHIEKFQPGEIILIGKNVPHMWLNDEDYFQKNKGLQVDAIAVHFCEFFLGCEFLSIPEMQPLVQLFNNASQGIKFFDVPKTTKETLSLLADLDPSLRLVKTVEILVQLSKCTDYKLLSSKGFLNKFHKTENRRLNLVYEFVFQNFHKSISAKDVAKEINMNPSAFSRFFRTMHRKPFTRFLNEIRIGYACKLLLEAKESITSIGYSCGFNNISNFNRQFRIIKGESPTSFIHRYKKDITG